MPTPDGWDTWSKFIRSEVKRLGDNSDEARKEVRAIYKEIAEINAQLASLKTRAGLWGAVGAAVPVLIMLGVQILMR